TELVYLTFNVLKAGNTSVTWTCDSWVGDETPADGSITITAADEPTTEEPTTEEPTTEEPTTEEEITEQISPDGYLTYEIKNGEAIITDCDTSISGDYTIPDTLGGYPVTSIGTFAFEECKSLKSIIIPDSVTSIDYGGFYYCESLNNVIMSDNITEIGAWAFFYCESLESIDIPTGITEIKEYTFYGCESLTTVEIPDSVTSIYWYAFAWSPALETVKIGSNVKLIDMSAFENCSSLISIEIPDSVETIGNSAFSNCTSLESVTIGSNVTSIGFCAFCDCTSLASITIPAGVNTIDDYAVGYAYEDVVYIAVDVLTIVYTVIDGFTIYGYEGTAAQTYANENGITFIPLDENSGNDEPTVTEDPTIEFNEESNQVTVSPETSAETFAEFANVGNVQVVSADGEELTADDFIGTGCKIQTLDEDGNVISEYTVIVPSDVDGNGKITAADARIALRTAAQLDTLDGVYAVAADFDADSAIKPSDARAILRVAAKLD
ncbi:MAG: leucine-rich repeat protein, partial [Clostridiales bacterium]|nr:leucine-rich repeat protein [Clostridiales bacterium]